MILGPAMPHSGKGAVKSPATDAVSDTLMRCRASQRRFRNTLIFVAADEASLGTAREVMRKAIAWDEIAKTSALHRNSRRRSSPTRARRQRPTGIRR